MRASTFSVPSSRSNIHCGSITSRLPAAFLTRKSIFHQKLFRRPLSVSPLAIQSMDLVIVGSANADIVLQLNRVPAAGETIGADHLSLFPGGKGANQAAIAALASPSSAAYFIAQVGNDANGGFLLDELGARGVRLDHVRRLADGTPTGTAVILLERASGENRIIIVGGANTAPWDLSAAAMERIGSAGILLLQREVPEAVNVRVARFASERGVPVLLDAGGADEPLTPELLSSVSIFSPNESELGRITGLPTDTEEQILAAAETLLNKGPSKILLKLGGQGSMLVTKAAGGAGLDIVRQPILPAPAVVDTTGAGDCFTGAFAVALVEGRPPQESLRFASAAASLCVRSMGAMSSLPARGAIEALLREDAA